MEYTCQRCKKTQEKEYDFDFDPRMWKCGDCMVDDIMRYADTFGVD